MTNKIKKSVVTVVAISMLSAQPAAAVPATITNFFETFVENLANLGSQIASDVSNTGAQIASDVSLNSLSMSLSYGLKVKEWYDQAKNMIYDSMGGYGPYAKEAVEKCLKLPDLGNLAGKLNLDFGLGCAQGILAKMAGLDQLLSFKASLSGVKVGKMRSSRYTPKKKADAKTRRAAKEAEFINADDGSSVNAANNAETGKISADSNPTVSSANAKQDTINSQYENAKTNAQIANMDTASKLNQVTNPAQAYPKREVIDRVKSIKEIDNADDRNKEIIKFQQETGLNYLNVLASVEADASSNYKNSEMVGDKVYVLPTIKADGSKGGGNVPTTTLMIEGNNLENYNKIREEYVKQLQAVKDASSDATSSSNSGAKASDLSSLEGLIDNVGVTPLTTSLLSMFQSGTVMANVVADANKRAEGNSGEASNMTDGQKAALSTAQTQAIVIQLVLLNQNIFEMNKLLAELTAKQHAETQQRLNDINYQIKQVQQAVEYLNASTKR